MTPGAKPATYMMGHTDRERRRLSLQASILNPLTERFLRSAGLSAGMRVLDVGTGAGDLALIAARIAGPQGEVVGIDTDERALEIARERAEEAQSHHVSFECTNFDMYQPSRHFDVVVARHVLIHSPDPLGMIRKSVALLVPGGILALQEYDLSFWPAAHPAAPLASRLQGAMVDLFQRATPHANVGMRLYHLMQAAGLATPQSRAECLMEGGPDSHFYEWFAETVRSLLPALNLSGIGVSAADSDTLADRLREETVDAQACITSPLIVSASAKKERN
jgi:ubiquinone/menaquinone biosynthesis C-methylase UbiE